MQSIFKKTCLLDTNVLVAYTNRAHPNHKRAALLFDALLEGKFKTVISIQNVLELSAVLIHGMGLPRNTVADDLRVFTTDSHIGILYPNTSVLSAYIKNLKVYPTLHAVDVYLLTTALEFGIQVLVSADKAFINAARSVISVYNPFI